MLNQRGFHDAKLLVRFRSATGDGRAVVDIATLVGAVVLTDEKGRTWVVNDIHDVYPLLTSDADVV